MTLCVYLFSMLHVTSYHTFSDLKQHTFIISLFLWVRHKLFLWNSLTESSAQDLTRLQLRCWPTLVSHLEAQLGKDPLPRSRRSLAELICL